MWLRLAGRYVDPVFQHSQRHFVGLVRDLVTAGSVDFVEDAVEHVGLFLVSVSSHVFLFSSLLVCLLFLLSLCILSALQ